MQYRYYIVDIHATGVKGTDDRKVAIKHAQNDQIYVIDTESGEWMLPDDEHEAILEAF